MSKTPFTEFGMALFSATTPEARRGVDYLTARAWTATAIKAFRFRWATADQLQSIWSKRLKGHDPIGGLVLPFPNNPYYASIRPLYPDGTVEQDEHESEDDEETEKAPKFLLPLGRSVPFIPFASKRGPVEAFVESYFKAALAASKGLKVIGVNGCTGCREPGAEFSMSMTKDEARAWFRPELLPFILENRPTELWTDADVLSNLNVRRAQLDFLDAAKALGAEPRHRPIPNGGVDDYLAIPGNSINTLRKLPTYEPASKYIETLRNAFRDRTEFDLADRFIVLHGDDLRFSPLGWFAWDGKRWRNDNAAELVALEKVRATVNTLKDEANAEKNPVVLKERIKAIYQFQSNAKVQAILALAKNTWRIHIATDAFDADSGYLGVDSAQEARRLPRSCTRNG